MRHMTGRPRAGPLGALSPRGRLGGALVSAALLAGGAAAPMLVAGARHASEAGARHCAAEALDPAAAKGLRLSFEEDFERLDLFDGLRGRWQTKFVWGGRTIPTNQELQIYVDPGFAGASGEPLGLNPFSVNSGVLAVSARKADPATRAKVGGFPYLSGLLTTARSFQQTYGYFEVKAKMPAGAGLWPAFWLLPPEGKWPPEIDVFEVVGSDPTRLVVSAHSGSSGKPVATSTAVAVPDTSLGFHDYGVLWTPDRLAWFFDGCRVAETATPADMHGPMYMLLNLAVGGSWAGNPDRNTPFPASLLVDRVRAFALE